MNIKRFLSISLAAAAVTGMCLLAPVAAWATNGTTVYYTGQGFNYDGTTWNLNDERCGLEGQTPANDGGTGQFANWNGEGKPYETGQGYLVWVLTANGATSAILNLPSPEGTVTMIKVGGTFKYASQYYSPEVLLDPAVTAVYQGKAKGNVQLVVSHGCKPYLQEQGAWCSPGFWKNAQDKAWGLTGHNKTDLFNNTVVPSFYDTAFTSVALPSGPTLIQVLTTPGANTFGGASNPYGLNAFNATGAFLSDNIPGYTFDPSLIPAPGQTEDYYACPIDNKGEFKQ